MVDDRVQEVPPVCADHDVVPRSGGPDPLCQLIELSRCESTDRGVEVPPDPRVGRDQPGQLIEREVVTAVRSGAES